MRTKQLLISGLVIAATFGCSGTSVTNVSGESGGSQGVDGGTGTGGASFSGGSQGVSSTKTGAGGATSVVGGSSTGALVGGGVSTGGQSTVVGGASGGQAPSSGGSATGSSNTAATNTGGTLAGVGGTTGSISTTSVSGGVSSVGGTSATSSVGTTGSALATGGVAPTGGALATGGGSAATGGAARTGGALATGGTAVTGGAAPTGGTLATGGAAPTGGTSATGGMRTGGTSATGGSTGDNTAPSVTKVTPASNAKGVTADASISITFSEAMDQDATRSAISVSGYLSGNLSFSWNAGSTVVTVKPTTPFAYNSGTNPGSTTATSYTGTVSTAATDLAGNPLTSAFTSSFTTLRQITQSFDAKTSAHYYSYGLAVSGGEIEICASSSETYKLGHTVTAATSGDYYGLAEIVTTLPGDLVGISGATLTVQQSTPEPSTNGFYTSGGTVRMSELPYQALAATGMSWLSSATPVYTWPTLSAAYSTNSSLDITSQFASEVGSGQSASLYRVEGVNGPTNTYAVYYCAPVTLAVQYLVP